MADIPHNGALMYWPRLAAEWPALPHPARRRILREAARTVHRLWREGCDLHQLPFELWALRPDAQAPAIQLPPGTLPQRRRPMSHAGLIDLLADWHEHTETIFSTRDGLVFLDEFFRHESADRAALRYAAGEIDQIARSLLSRRVRAVYKRHLQGSRHRSLWTPNPGMAPATLRAALTDVEQHPDTKIIKQHEATCVMRANLLGQDVLIKRYDLAGPLDRLKYRYRPSRARRAWAAGRTLLHLNIPTAEPLGFLEIYSGRVPTRSYIITRFIDDAVTAHEWIRVRYRSLTPAERDLFFSQVLHHFLLLHRRAVYHADTKALNLLVQHPDDPASRRMFWIDLECVQAGVFPSRHQVVRNLVQLNGSLRTWVSTEDRMAVLQQVARVYPWVLRPAVLRKIRRWTRRRLAKEVRLRCGP